MSDCIFIPFLKVGLEKTDTIDLGFGFSITKEPDYINMIKSSNDLKSGYENSVNDLSIGLKYTLTNNHLGHDFKVKKEDCFYIIFLLRALTGIPIDFPWIFYYGCSHKTLIHLYQRDKYVYQIDDNSYKENIQLLKNNIEEIVKRITDYTNEKDNEDRFIQAIEFVSIAYQMHHIATRLVNMVTFFEILFSNQRFEITHHLCERLSWYIEHDSPHEREKLYNKF